MVERLTIGTRGSALALVQSHWVRDRLQQLNPSLDIHVLIIRTEGDASQATNRPLATYSDKGVFAKELEVALLGGEIDVAVHSMKDLAAVLPIGLQIAAVPLREDVRDAVVGIRLSDLAAGARVGTGSVRRRALVNHLRPDLQVLDIRGNVDSRVSKLRDGTYDSIILAVAGLNRLGRSNEIAEKLDPTTFVPDPGQGALAVQTRTDDDRVKSFIAPLDHALSSVAIKAERSFLAAFDAGCQTPVGAWAQIVGENIEMIAMAALDGAVPKTVLVTCSVAMPAEAGFLAARALGR